MIITPKVNDMVSHIGIVGKKFKIHTIINNTHCEIIDLETSNIYLEPNIYLLTTNEAREQLLKFILDE